MRQALLIPFYTQENESKKNLNLFDSEVLALIYHSLTLKLGHLHLGDRNRSAGVLQVSSHTEEWSQGAIFTQQFKCEFLKILYSITNMGLLWNKLQDL